MNSCDLKAARIKFTLEMLAAGEKKKQARESVAFAEATSWLHSTGGSLLSLAYAPTSLVVVVATLLNYLV